MNSTSLFTIIYAILAIISFSLIFIYRKMFKNNLNIDGLRVSIAIFVVNFGYFLLSCTHSLQQALLFNRLVYLGNVVLLIEMSILINKFCNGTKNKLTLYLIVGISSIILLLVMSGGTSIKWYYTNASIITENGLTILVKEYGPYHYLYAIYVFGMIMLMIAKIVYAIVKKEIANYINPVVLVLIATENAFVWFVEKFIDTRFELISVSYIITELMFIFLFKNAEMYKKMQDEAAKNKTITVETIIEEWSSTYSLTEREIDILKLLIDNISRADIAKELFISEHTVKKHTANLYNKLCVTSRNDLLYKLNEEIYR